MQPHAILAKRDPGQASPGNVLYRFLVRIQVVVFQEKQGVPALTTWVGGSIPQVGSSGRYSSGKRLLLFLFTGFQFKKQVLIFSLWCEIQPKYFI